MRKVRTSKPLVDPAVREQLYKKIEERFITPKERAARIEAAYRVLGYRTMTRFATDNGIYPGTLQKILAGAPKPSLMMLYKLSVALGRSLSYLTERNYFIEDQEEGDE